MTSPTDIHEMARRMVAQSPRPMTMSEAYAELGRRGTSARRRRNNYGRTTITFDKDRTAFGVVRLPYVDD